MYSIESSGADEEGQVSTINNGLGANLKNLLHNYFKLNNSGIRPLIFIIRKIKKQDLYHFILS